MTPKMQSNSAANSSQITVLHVIARLNVGGTARYLTQLAEHLPNHNVKIVIASGYVQGEEVEDPSASQFKIIRIPSLGRAINLIADYKAYKELKRVVADLKPDLIHTHTFKAGLIGRIRNLGVPVVHTFHGHLFTDPEFKGVKGTVIRLIEKYLAPRSHSLVTVGVGVAQDLIKKGIGVRSQYRSIAPGVLPLDVTKRSKAFKNVNLTDDGKFVVGWIARMTGVKNPQRALEIAQQIPNLHFVMAGGGDLLDSIKAKAGNNVSVVGWQDARDVFGACDLVLSTSENEGMPVALIEAQLAGLPVVATNVGAVAEVVDSGATGWVVATDNAALVHAIRKVVDSPDKGKDMGQAAATRAQKLFSVDRMITAHVDLYRSIELSSNIVK
jgi:glycosyltransferase involved in cell wall biosynthesis